MNSQIDPAMKTSNGQPLPKGTGVAGFKYMATVGIAIYAVIMFNEGPEAFWTALLELALVGFLLLNWRAVIMPTAYVQHFKKYQHKFRIFTVSALLVAAFLAWVAAPILFVGMLGFAWYMLKADPWTKEMKDYASRRWTQILVVIALAISGFVGAIQYIKSQKADIGQSYQLEQRRRVFDCATEEWAAKKVVGAVKHPCEDDPVKRAAMNAPGLADRLNNSAPGLIPAAVAMLSDTGATLVKTLKYWVMLAVIFALLEMTRATAVAKKYNRAMDDAARTFLIEAGVPQTEKNVEQFLREDARASNIATAMCEKEECHPAMLKRAGQGESFYNWLARAPLYLMIPVLPAFIPLIGMYMPSKLNAARYQYTGPNMGSVLRGLIIERL